MSVKPTRAAHFVRETGMDSAGDATVNSTGGTRGGVKENLRKLFFGAAWWVAAVVPQTKFLANNFSFKVTMENLIPGFAGGVHLDSRRAAQCRWLPAGQNPPAWRRA